MATGNEQLLWLSIDIVGVHSITSVEVLFHGCTVRTPNSKNDKRSSSSLCPMEAKWLHGFEWALAQVMTVFLVVPNHYQNQCWFNCFACTYNLIVSVQDINFWNEWEKYTCMITCTTLKSYSLAHPVSDYKGLVSQQNIHISLQKLSKSCSFCPKRRVNIIIICQLY